ncbi:hypothetical protein FKM82_011253 [Ascaphus truei]|uniref:mesogenin-1 n=1 Tax=Ascaphus truei TaxID=8439 RepID=UPI003F59B237
MDTMHQPILKMEEDYVLGSDSDPDSAYLSASWDWKNSGESYSLSQTPSPQSLSPAISYESSFSACSHPPGLKEMPFGSEMVTYRLLHYPTHCLQETGRAKGGRKRGHKASMSTQRRRKASEREKLRMRAISEALRTLRNNLPPIYSQGRQPLTKIQTLKCTISYISELSDLLNNVKGT